MIAAIRHWLKQRRLAKLHVQRAELSGYLFGCYAAGYESPRYEGKLARVIEQLRQLEAP